MTETMNEQIAVPLWNIKPSRWQPRDAHFDADELYELAQSINDNGLINPVLVFANDDEDGYVVWELIAGERRTRATVALKLAELFPTHTLQDWCGRLAHVGLHGMGMEEHTALRQDKTATIPATVHAGRDMQRIHVMAVIENIDRASLTPIEEARAYQSLMQAYGWSQREVAGHVNKSQGYVAQRLGLLGLNEAAAQALNTRVINMTHARALAVVPEALQAVATEYVVAEVKKDDAPATTRQIENQLRALAAFVEPERWEPNGQRVYMPQARNRLAVIKMLVSGPYAADRIAKGWAHLRLYNDGYETKNLLTAKPLTVVESDRIYAAITNALGMQPQDAWQNHAHQENKWCATCIFGEKWRPLTPGLTAYCPRWKKDNDVKTCDGWISKAYGPVVIPVESYDVREQLKDGPYLLGEPFQHTDSLEAYLDAYAAATNVLIERQAEKEDRAKNGPQRAIQEFWEWQKTLPNEYLRHSQAHACVVCKYFEPMSGDAPCRFANHPLSTRWGDGARAPEMGVLCGPTLRLLPRCEMFTRRQLPTIYRQPQFNVGTGKLARQNFLQWMRIIKKQGNSFSYYARYYMWRGIFAWLYPDSDGDSYSWNDIESHLAKNWDTIGDVGMATLLNALLREVQAANTYKDTIELLDLTTGDAELWRPIAFAERHNEQKDWPKDWLRPWMMKTLAEVFTTDKENEQC